MLKTKVFCEVSQYLEPEMNKWLALNPHITIHRVSQSQNNERTVLVLMYAENPPEYVAKLYHCNKHNINYTDSCHLCERDNDVSLGG